MLADFRYAFRQLRSAPGFALVAVLSLALGIGVTTATYTVVGVMPPGFDLPSTQPPNAMLPSRTPDVWVPSGIDPVAGSPGDQSWWALGRRLLGTRDSALTIVGVVGDVREVALDAPPSPTVYLPVAQEADLIGSFVVRTRGAPLALARAARGAIASVDPEQPVMAVRSMGDYVAQALDARRFSLFLTAVFAGSALVLAMVGLYGLLAYLVAQRTRELGVRVALGAQRLDVARLVLGGALKLGGPGALIGAPAALGAGRLLRAQLYGVGPGDPVTILGVALVLLGTAAAAALVPTRRAARVDPAVALRSE